MAGFLSDYWRDLLSLGGFLGTVFAIWQIFRTKRLARASKEAIEGTLKQTKAAFSQYAMAASRRLLGEAKIFFDAANWPLAALRLGDLAEQAAQLAQSIPEDAAAWSDLAEDVRKWEATCRKLQASKLQQSDNLTSKWHHFTNDAAGRLDRSHGPFAGNSNG